jgi:hypothetical protein
MWRPLTLLALAAVLIAGEAPAQTEADRPTQVVKISVRELDLFDGPTGKPVRSLSKAEAEALLPLGVLRVEPNTRLKVSIKGIDYWIDGSAVRTNVVERPPGCDAAPKVASALVTRGSGDKCK